MPFDQSVPNRGAAAEPLLLDDRQMREFVTRGYLTFRLDLPEAFHRHVRERALEDIRRCEEAGIRSPLNNALPRIPALRRVFDHPRVAGALTSILGAGYYLHLHRHMHDNRPGSDAQTIHQDSLHNSRFAVDGNRRHHHCRWAMAFYYPQDTTLDMGPSAVAPGSQYLTEGAGLDAEQALEGPAGTVTIVHYDLFHRGLANRSGDTRLMIKFLFARMEEPVRPSWNATQAAWPEERGSRWPATGSRCGAIIGGGSAASPPPTVKRRRRRTCVPWSVTWTMRTSGAAWRRPTGSAPPAPRVLPPCWPR